jgi:hypothetical protein
MAIRAVHVKLSVYYDCGVQVHFLYSVAYLVSHRKLSENHHFLSSLKVAFFHHVFLNYLLIKLPLK